MLVSGTLLNRSAKGPASTIDEPLVFGGGYAVGTISGTEGCEAEGAVGVRRLTPLECERLQGFADDWTLGQSDAARYRMLGNAVAVPVVTWIATRLLDKELSRVE